MPATANAVQILLERLRTGDVQIIDLTQPLGPETPVIRLPDIFAQTPPCALETLSDFDDRGPAWRWSALRVGEHTGTHFDAPGHWITGRDLPDNTTDTIPAQRLVGPACVIDCSLEAAENPDFLLTAERIRGWESEHGAIPAGAWLLMRTDWSKRTDPDEFLNMRGGDAHTPGFAVDAVRLLAEERDILGVGVETVGTDAGQAGAFEPPFPAHAIMHGAGRYGLASLRNLDRLPATGAMLVAAPLRIVGGSGSPCRVLAFAPAR